MKPRTRSLSGAFLMLALVPAIVGLLACLPVPIGDPERSRIDPDITGAWVRLNGETATFFVFEQYDKRTWLLTGIGMQPGDQREKEATHDLSSYAALAKLVENESVGPYGVTARRVSLYKVWLTKLGGERFMTWEPKGVYDNENFAPEAWFAFRFDRPDSDTIDLYLIGDSLFKEVEQTRRAYERVIRKNARNPELYDDETVQLVRVDEQHRGFVAKLAAQVIAE